MWWAWPCSPRIIIGQLLLFATTPCSRIKAFFCYPWCGLFLTCRKKKSISTLHNKGLWLFLLCWANKYYPIWATGHVAGAGANPFCPHAHSTLIFTSPLPLATVFIDAFTALPTGTAWLGRLIEILEQLAPILGFWATHTFTLTQDG